MRARRGSGIVTDILEIKNTLAGERKEFLCELCAREDGHAVVLYRLKREVNLAGVRMPAGTLSFGHYWTDRHYNVYHWLLPDGTTKAYYFNLADRTCIRDDAVEWRDLVVDVMVTPDGAARVLDEDELPADLNSLILDLLPAGLLHARHLAVYQAASPAPDYLDSATRATIESTVAHLLAHHLSITAEVEASSRRFLGD